MIEPKDHKNESERLKELDSYSILDTLPESDYDDITAIAAELCDCHISLISLVDDKRQWFKSHHGLAATETPKEYAFCAHAINDQENIFVIEDSRIDERFHDNPLVTGEPKVIFYAGVPLVSEKNLPLGTLCVIDDKPKSLSQSQLDSLQALGNQVMNILNLRKAKAEIEKAVEDLKEKNQELERFASVAAHDLKSPLSGINGLVQLFTKDYGHKIDEDGKDILRIIQDSSDKLMELIKGLLEHSRSDKVLKEEKAEIKVHNLKENLTRLFSYEKKLNLTLNSDIDSIVTNRTALMQILINLVSNAIKYNDKEQIEIELGVSATDKHYKFYVKDNGPGITPENQEKIFEIFKVFASKDRYGQSGNGIGLATVKKVVEKSGGTIGVESELGNGAKFTFTIEK